MKATLLLLIMLALPIGLRADWIDVWDSVMVVDTIYECRPPDYMLYEVKIDTTYHYVSRKVEWPISYWYESHEPDTVEYNPFEVKGAYRDVDPRNLVDWGPIVPLLPSIVTGKLPPTRPPGIYCDTIGWVPLVYEAPRLTLEIRPYDYMDLDTSWLPVIKCDTVK